MVEITAMQVIEKLDAWPVERGLTFSTSKTVNVIFRFLYELNSNPTWNRILSYWSPWMIVSIITIKKHPPDQQDSLQNSRTKIYRGKNGDKKNNTYHGYWTTWLTAMKENMHPGTLGKSKISPV